MHTVGIGVGMFMVLCGTAAVTVAAWRSRHASSLVAYLQDTGNVAAPAPVPDLRLAEPLARRVLAETGCAAMVMSAWLSTCASMSSQ